MDRKKKAVYFKKVEEEPFARHMGIKLVDVDEGYAVCEMRYTDEMDNLYRNAHGGAIFSLIDEAFEISSNSHDRIAVALNMNVTYMKPPKKGSLLKAESKEIMRTRRTASYNIAVKDEEGLVATCQALVYIKDQEIPFLKDT
ncbi:MAG TPA: PaaI family thioesterase [Syntrophorhabdaceae bacterium]|nr:PaaI family thioesterase [Syntrophorhabdaceae bacterium]